MVFGSFEWTGNRIVTSSSGNWLIKLNQPIRLISPLYKHVMKMQPKILHWLMMRQQLMMRMLQLKKQLHQKTKQQPKRRKRMLRMQTRCNLAHIQVCLKTWTSPCMVGRDKPLVDSWERKKIVRKLNNVLRERVRKRKLRKREIEIKWDEEEERKQMKRWWMRKKTERDGWENMKIEINYHLFFPDKLWE